MRKHACSECLQHDAVSTRAPTSPGLHGNGFAAATELQGIAEASAGAPPQCITRVLLLLQAEIARVEASNASQAAALKEQEAQLRAKEIEVEAAQAGLEKQTQQIEKKGRDLYALNRRYEKAVADVPKGEDAGTPFLHTEKDSQHILVWQAC